MDLGKILNDAGKFLSNLADGTLLEQQTAKVSESTSENGNGYAPMPSDLDVSQEWSSTLSGTESDSSLQKSSGEHVYGLELIIQTYGSPEQALQEAGEALKVLRLAGIEVSHYRITRP